MQNCGKYDARSQSGDTFHTGGKYYSLLLQRFSVALIFAIWFAEGWGKQGTVYKPIIQQSKVKLWFEIKEFFMENILELLAKLICILDLVLNLAAMLYNTWKPENPL